MKAFCVSYKAPIVYEAVVKAKTKKAAIEKVKEVIGTPIIVDSAWEVKSAS